MGKKKSDKESGFAIRSLKFKPPICISFPFVHTVIQLSLDG